MVWGVFSFNGFTDLVRLDGNLNSEKYVDILNGNLLPQMNELLPTGGYFQQDNAPVHRSATTTAWLAGCEINLLDWPPYIVRT